MALPVPTPGPISGRVESVNDNGVKIDGEWFNFSKWAGPIERPERGDNVTLTLDRSGFVRVVRIAEAAPEASPAPRRAPGPVSGQREATITRLAVLKAAAEFGASRPDLKSSDVLQIAAMWETWVNRPAIDDELDEAF